MKKDFIWYASAQSANRFPVEPIICPIFSKFSIQNTFIKHQKNNFQRQIENLKISEIQSLPLFDYLPKCKRSHFFELNTNISSFGADSRLIDKWCNLDWPIFRWRCSLWRLIWKELVLYTGAYMVISSVYRWGLLISTDHLISILSYVYPGTVCPLSSKWSLKSWSAGADSNPQVEKHCQTFSQDETFKLSVMWQLRKSLLI